MAFLEVNYFSQTLGMEQVMNVILPEVSDRHPERTIEELKDLPVLYLLHGMGGNHTNWQRYTRIERLVRDTKLAVVMPNTDLAWYTNTTYGLNYFDALALELPQKVQQLFPQISTKREKNFVAGLSMGGYGAWKLALSGNRFSYAASLSGALVLKEETLGELAQEAYWEGVFGKIENFRGSEHDLLALAKKKTERLETKDLPKLYAWCGLEDFLFFASEEATKKVQELGFSVTYEKSDGDHEWYYWDQYIERVLEWLPIGYQKEEQLS